MRPFIPRQRGERPLPGEGISDRDRKAVTLDRLMEYRLILPLIEGDLKEKLSQTDPDEEPEGGERRHQMARRLEYVRGFQWDVYLEPYDETRSIDLTHTEAGVAAYGLVHAIGVKPMRPGEADVRTKYAAWINMCARRTEVLEQHDVAMPAAAELPLYEDG